MDNYFKDIQLNDRVFSIAYGWGTVTVINNECEFRVKFENNDWCYLPSGRRVTDEYQTLFWDEVKIIPPPRPKRKVKKQKVFTAVKNKGFMSYEIRDWYVIPDGTEIKITYEWEEEE